MGAILDALLRLQEVELQIAEISRGINRKLQAVKKQENRIAECEAQVSARQTAVRADQVEADRHDLDLKSREADTAKLRQALNLAKTNKEYSAVLTQLNTNKADNSKIEDRVLAMMNQIEAKKKEIAALQQERLAEVGRLAEFKAAHAAAVEKARDRLAALTKQREQAASAVPGRALEFFNRVAKKNDGEAMARVVRTHPKREEYACQGCNMAITIEQVNAIMSRDEAILCNVCGRILYMDVTAAPAH